MHLTIQWSRNVKINEVNDYGGKKGCARKRVDLSNEQVSTNLKAEITTRVKAPVATDPYRPPVGTTLSYEVQLKIEGCNILPTGSAD